MPSSRTTDGFSYVEVLVATALLATALLPAMDAVSGAGQQVDQLAADVAERQHLSSLMEEVLAEPWDDLLAAAAAAGDRATPTSYSDGAGAAAQRLVFIGRYDADADPFVVPDPDLDGDGNAFTGYRGLLWIRTARAEPPGELVSLTAP